MSVVDVLASGVYAIELSPRTVKIGQSSRAHQRVHRHIANARTLGIAPARYQVFQAPEDMLRACERACHQAVRELGGQTGESPEVFAGLDYEQVVQIIPRVIAGTVERQKALTRLRSLTDEQLGEELSQYPLDIAYAVCEALGRVNW